MLFTIAIPTYNNERTIANAVRSALTQNYSQEYEVLVVNNASKDKTLDKIKEFDDPKLRVISNPETVDMYVNHNICLNQAKGDYIVFCHSDDYLCEDALLILHETLQKRLFPKKYMVWGHSMFRDFQDRMTEGGQQLNTVISGIPALRCFCKGGVSPSGACYSRESLIAIGGFPSLDAKVQLSDWYIMIFTVFHFFEFEMVDRLLFIREYGSTAVNNMTWKDWWPNYSAVLNRLEKDLTPAQIKIVAACLMKDIRYYPWVKKYMSTLQKCKYLTKSFVSKPLATIKYIIL